MHISALVIRHFRNFMNARFNFEEGVNTLIGENGVGKTNAFHALRLLVDESLPRNATSLRETDFCRSLGAWKGHWIIISINFEKLDPSEGCQLIKHHSGHMNASQTGTHTFYFRPKFDVRKELHTLSTTKRADALARLKTLSLDDYEAVLTGRATADFNDDTAYKKIAGDLTRGVFPNPDDDDANLLGVKVYPLHQEIACTFIKALRDVMAELQNYRGNPLLNLLRGLESSIKIADAKKITEAIGKLNEDISSLDEIRGLAQGIQAALLKAVGHTFSPEISIESTLPDSLERLLQRLGIRVGDASAPGHRGEMGEQSLGSANLIYLALKFLEYELKLASDRAAHFLLIEEPEAHLHAHVQKTLFTNLGTNSAQVIVSTHSTQISSISKIKSVNILARQAGYCAVYQPANGLESKTVGRVERYIDAVRSTLLFAKGVMLVEGEAELIMVPAMIRAVFGVGVDELGVSVIAMDSAFFEHIAVIFSDDRIRRHCAIISDLDQSLITLPDDPESDSKEEAHARASQAAGINRRDSLRAFTSGNSWVAEFLAKHTLEVDFIHAGNAWEVQDALTEIYGTQSNIDKSSAKLSSDDEVVAGREVLRLAHKKGKGWFALLLSEKLFERTVIPEYIMRALAYSCQDVIGGAVLKQIGLYRLKSTDMGNELPENLTSDISRLEAMPPAEFIALYRREAPDDQLSKLCAYVDEAQIAQLGL